MPAIDYLAALRRENEAFHAAINPERLATRVEPCPEWNLADLVWHMGEVHWFWGSIAEGRLTDPSQAEAIKPERPADPADLLHWARISGERIQRVLAEADPDAAVWTWAPQKNIQFICRRMAHETAVHRWDAQITSLGEAQPIEAALAVDGIDEFLAYMLPYALGQGEPFEATVHLHCTDIEGEWLIGPGAKVVVGHIKGDVALRGTASKLLLALWRRVSLDQVDVVGNRSVAEKMINRLKVY